MSKTPFKKRHYFFAILIFAFSLKCQALEQHAKLWLGVNSQQTLSENKKWRSFIYSQFRFIDQSHPWQSTQLEGGIGYHLSSDKSIWAGYRWSANNPNNGFFQGNRLFQQVILQKKLIDESRLVFRTRLEEIQLSNESQIALRLRQRMALELKRALFENAFPVLYDEVFFQLNHTSYTPNTFIGENRLFIGFNLFHSKKTWWEMGYINQYQIHTPQQRQNQMSHVISITYNFS